MTKTCMRSCQTFHHLKYYFIHQKVRQIIDEKELALAEVKERMKRQITKKDEEKLQGIGWTFYIPYYPQRKKNASWSTNGSSFSFWSGIYLTQEAYPHFPANTLFPSLKLTSGERTHNPLLPRNAVKVKRRPQLVHARPADFDQGPRMPKSSGWLNEQTAHRNTQSEPPAPKQYPHAGHTNWQKQPHSLKLTWDYGWDEEEGPATSFCRPAAS